jgi:hypothetical protein
LNEDSALYERIDMILVRNDLGHPPLSFPGPVLAWIIGDGQDDKTLSGLWPSDHAGVMAWFGLPLLK